MLEVEVKIKTPHNTVVSKIEELGFLRGTTEYEKDVYYNGISTDLKAEDKALRIREYRSGEMNKSGFVMNYKGPRLDESTMTRPETEFEIPGFGEGDLLLRGIGFVPKGIVEKKRVNYRKENITCCLDTVTGLGEFIEIEILAADEGGYDEAMKQIEKLLDELGLDMSLSIRNSYLSMLAGTTD